MALTDIVFSGANTVRAARGNTGTVVNTVFSKACASRFIDCPGVSDVKDGVAYGRQGAELTGTYLGPGGAFCVVGSPVVRAVP